MNTELRKCVPERRPLSTLLRNLIPLAKDGARAGKYAEDVQALLEYFAHALNNDDHSWAIIARLDAAIDQHMRLKGDYPRDAKWYLGQHEMTQLRYVADRTEKIRMEPRVHRSEYRGIPIYTVDAPEHLHLS